MAIAVWGLFRAENLPVAGLALGENGLGSLVRDRILSSAAECVVEQGHGQWLAKLRSPRMAQDILMSFKAGLHAPGLGLDHPLYLKMHGAYAEGDLSSVSPLLEAALNASRTPCVAINALSNAPSLLESVIRESAIEHALANALKNGLFYQEYQPIVSLQSGLICAAEALLRIDGSKYGPAEFIPVSEQTGGIFALGEQSLFMASAFSAQLEAEGLPLTIAANVSPLQLAHPEFVAFAHGLALTVEGEGGERALNVELEITESVALDDEAFVTLRALRRLGFRLAFDDFGTGASSLRQLLRCPPGKVKFDRSMVALLAQPSRLEQFKNLVRVAREHGCSVVAEGIETAEQLALSRRAGVDFAQGFYLGKPMAGSELRLRLIEQIERERRFVA